MDKILRLYVCLLFCMSFYVVNAQDYFEGVLELKFRNLIDTPIVESNTFHFNNKTIDSVFRNSYVKHIRSVYPNVRNIKHRNTPLLMKIYRIKCDIGKENEVQKYLLQNLNNTIDTVYRISKPLSNSAPLLPNDYGNSYNSHWHLQNMRLPEAWQITTGSKDIVINIFDEPFYYTQNLELEGKIVRMGEEISNYTITGSNHGTVVAAAAAGNPNNSYGIVGTGYNSSLGLFSKPTINITIVEPNSIIINEMQLNPFSRISNHSYGSLYTTLQKTSNFEKPINDFLNDMGAILVAAAGNGNFQPGFEIFNDYIPAFYDNYISVTAIDRRDSYESEVTIPGTGNNFGLNVPMVSTHNLNVDISAPGLKFPGFNITNCFPAYDVYRESNGTSYATPMVSGIVALMLSVNPWLSPEQVKHILVKTATNIDNVGNNAYYRNMVGAGAKYAPRVDAYEAVKMARDFTGDCHHISDLNITTILDASTSDDIFPYFTSRNTITANNQISNTYPASVKYVTSSNIHLTQGFRVQKGASFRAQLNTIRVYCDLPPPIITPPSTLTATLPTPVISGPLTVCPNSLSEYSLSNASNYPSGTTFRWEFSGNFVDNKCNDIHVSYGPTFIIPNGYNNKNDYNLICIAKAPGKTNSSKGSIFINMKDDCVLPASITPQIYGYNCGTWGSNFYFYIGNTTAYGSELSGTVFEWKLTRDGTTALKSGTGTDFSFSVSDLQSGTNDAFGLECKATMPNRSPNTGNRIVYINIAGNCSNSRLSSEDTTISNATNSNEQFSVLPNPNAGSFTFNCLSSETYSIKIMDIFGNEVKALENNDSSKIDFNLANIPKGVYVLRYLSLSGAKKYFKVILQ